MNGGLQVALFCGGTSAERDISLKSGEAVLQAIKALGHQPILIDPSIGLAAWSDIGDVADVAFVALHGGDGEGGTIQAALELMPLAYTGSGVAASALALNKVHSKLVWQASGLPTPEFLELPIQSDEHSCRQALTALGGQAFLKPNLEGSSKGIYKVGGNHDDVWMAMQQARRYGPILLEKTIEGEELTVAILDGQALPVIRLATDRNFYDYDAKYVTGDTRYIIPSGLKAAEEQEVQDLALRAFNLLGCSQWGRVDLMRDKDGGLWLLEVNTVPGLTEHSLVPKAAAQVGLDFNALIGRLLAGACLKPVAGPIAGSEARERSVL